MGLDRPCPEHAAEHEQKREDTKGDPPWDLAAARCTRHALPLSISLRELHDQSPAARRPACDGASVLMPISSWRPMLSRRAWLRATLVEQVVSLPGREKHMLDLHHVVDALRAAYDTWGYPIVLIGALLENTALLGLILPGGSLVLLGAVYAQQGALALPLVLLLGWLGMVLGTSLDYVFGRWALRSTLGHTRLMARLEPKLGEAERFLERHGAWAFLLAHFIGHIRSFVAITAGTSSLPYRRFLLYEGTAAFAWNLVFVGAGYLAGENVERLQRLVSGTGLAVAIVLLIVFVSYRLVVRGRSVRHEVTKGC